MAKSDNKKTSAEWIKETNYIIVDFDGWNVHDFYNSFYVEKITKAEFQKRLDGSTLIQK